MNLKSYLKNIGIMIFEGFVFIFEFSWSVLKLLIKILSFLTQITLFIVIFIIYILSNALNKLNDLANKFKDKDKQNEKCCKENKQDIEELYKRTSDFQDIKRNIGNIGNTITENNFLFVNKNDFLKEISQKNGLINSLNQKIEMLKNKILASNEALNNLRNAFKSYINSQELENLRSSFMSTSSFLQNVVGLATEQVNSVLNDRKNQISSTGSQLGGILAAAVITFATSGIGTASLTMKPSSSIQFKTKELFEKVNTDSAIYLNESAAPVIIQRNLLQTDRNEFIRSFSMNERAFVYRFERDFTCIESIRTLLSLREKTVLDFFTKEGLSLFGFTANHAFMASFVPLGLFKNIISLFDKSKLDEQIKKIADNAFQNFASHYKRNDPDKTICKLISFINDKSCDILDNMNKCENLFENKETKNTYNKNFNDILIRYFEKVQNNDFSLRLKISKKRNSHMFEYFQSFLSFFFDDLNIDNNSFISISDEHQIVYEVVVSDFFDKYFEEKIEENVCLKNHKEKYNLVNYDIVTCHFEMLKNRYYENGLVFMKNFSISEIHKRCEEALTCAMPEQNNKIRDLVMLKLGEEINKILNHFLENHENIKSFSSNEFCQFTSVISETNQLKEFCVFLKELIDEKFRRVLNTKNPVQDEFCFQKNDEFKNTYFEFDIKPSVSNHESCHSELNLQDLSKTTLNKQIHLQLDKSLAITESLDTRKNSSNTDISSLSPFKTDFSHLSDSKKEESTKKSNTIVDYNQHKNLLDDVENNPKQLDEYSREKSSPKLNIAERIRIAKRSIQKGLAKIEKINQEKSSKRTLITISQTNSSEINHQEKAIYEKNSKKLLI